MPVHTVKFSFLEAVNETNPREKEVTVCRERWSWIWLLFLFVMSFFNHLVTHHLRGICESRFIQKIEGAQR